MLGNRMFPRTVFGAKGSGSVISMIKNFVKIKEAVKLYGIGKEVFYRAIHGGELKAYIPNGRDFLLKVTEIEAWIETKEINTA